MKSIFNDNFSAHSIDSAESKLSHILANSRQDNVLVESKVVPLQELTGLSSRRGLENAIICENQIVNVVSNSYGHLPNEKFFLGVEEKLIDADIYYQQRSINRDNRSFGYRKTGKDHSLNSIITYQKGNITYILPYKTKSALHRFKTPEKPQQ